MTPYYENLLKDEERAKQQLYYATQALEAKMRGDEDAATEWLKYIPVDPCIASLMKEISGLDFVHNKIKEGFDFSLVEEQYGKEWFVR